MPKLPIKRTDQTHSGAAWNQSIDFATSLQVAAEFAPGIARGPVGTIARAARNVEPFNPLLFIFKSMEDDYLICHTWDGTNEGDRDVLIAKPPMLQFTITAQTIDGVAIAYSAYDTTAQTRHASDGGSLDEDQVITPRYYDGCLIYAERALCIRQEDGTPIDDVDGNRVYLMDKNRDAREWTQVS